MHMYKKMISIISLVGIICTFCANDAIYTHATSGYYNQVDIESLANGIIQWKKQQLGLNANDQLIQSGLVSTAGTSDSDWLVMALKRFKSSENTSEYLASLNFATSANIRKISTPVPSESSTSSPASTSSATIITDMFRGILTFTALGQNPQVFKIPEEGRQINLLSDYVYNRTISAEIGKQLINWLSWSLIAIDSMQYEIPQNRTFSREVLILEILKQQNPSGGFNLVATSKASDPDITAMVVQSLAPYYNSEKSYTYNRTIDNAKMTKTVRQAVDESILKLSAMQTVYGDYQTYLGTTPIRAVESTAQVALALCCLGIDPQKDMRFIKNGRTLIDGIMLYIMPDGGFSHEYPTTKSNHMASTQVLSTMVAITRQMKGMRFLYDMRAEQSASLKETINQIINKIAQISSKTSKSELLALSSIYNSIMDNERMYVYNYSKLSDALKKSGVSGIASGLSESNPNTVSKTTSGLSNENNSFSSNDFDFSQIINPDSTNGSTYINSDFKSDNSDSTVSDKKRNRAITTTFSILAILIIIVTMVYMNKKKATQ